MAFQKQEDGEDVSVLDYGINEAEVNRTIKNEEIKPLDLNRTPLEVAVENIDSVSKQEFTQLRRQGFGGSDSSMLLGVNPFQDINDLIASKVRTELSEEEKAIGELAAVRKGNDLEPLIINKATEILKTQVFKPKDMYRFKEFPFLTMNFDGVTDIEGKQYVPVEIKVCTYRGEKHYNKFKAIYDESSDTAQLEQANCTTENISIEEKAANYGIPPYYYTQLQQEMMALNAPYGFLAVLFESDWYVRIFKIHKDEATQNALVIKGYQTWQKVQAIKQHNGNI